MMDRFFLWIDFLYVQKVFYPKSTQSIAVAEKREFLSNGKRQTHFRSFGHNVDQQYITLWLYVYFNYLGFFQPTIKDQLFVNLSNQRLLAP